MERENKSQEQGKWHAGEERRRREGEQEKEQKE